VAAPPAAHRATGEGLQSTEGVGVVGFPAPAARAFLYTGVLVGTMVLTVLYQGVGGARTDPEHQAKSV